MTYRPPEFPGHKPWLTEQAREKFVRPVRALNVRSVLAAGDRDADAQSDHRQAAGSADELEPAR